MAEKRVRFDTLLNKTFVSVEREDNRLTFITDQGEKYIQYHKQECCENVYIEDICGDLNDLVGAPILRAEESTNRSLDEDKDSYTWTFYKLATAKGDVTIRWYGTSNGYYSEAAKLYLQNADIKVEVRKTWNCEEGSIVCSELVITYAQEQCLCALGIQGLHVLLYKTIMEGVAWLKDLKSRMEYIPNCEESISDTEKQAWLVVQQLITMGESASSDCRWLVRVDD